ncbi:MAG: hypothetical protein V1658_00530 [Candidatus Micrarchaeota archaeon]
MRFFKHGDSLAIVLPEKLRKNSEIKEDEDYEFFEAEKGTFILISRKNLEEQTKKSVIANLLNGKDEAAIAIKEGNIEAVGGNTLQMDGEASLKSKGFAVINSEEEARRISQQLEKQIKSNEIMGVRGFDKKFYIITAQYYKQNAPKILKTIGSREITLKDICAYLRMDESGCLSCLMVMKEAGEIIEKRKGLFKLI